MKAHFQKLLDYNSWANRRFLECLLENAVVNNRPYLLFSHLLTAEEVWLCRLQGTAEPIQHLWQRYPNELLGQMLAANAEAWQSQLQQYEDADFLKEITYRNSKGESFLTQLADIITHMVNHGTHHRGQISSLLQQEKVQPPVSDYIAYLRSGETRVKPQV